MEESFLGAFEGFDSAFDELFAAGRENLEPDIGGDGAGGFDEAAREVEVGLRGGGEGDFDFFVAKLAEHFEVCPFLFAVLGKSGRSACVLPV